jgi:hypothetical protein
MARLPRLALATVAALAVALCASLPAAVAAPVPAGPVRSVAIVAPGWLYLDGDLDLGVRVVTRNSTGRVAASLDLLDDTGVSRWHSYQSRSGLGSVTYEYSFSRAVRDLGIAPGVYRLRARVTSVGSVTVERSARLIVVDRSMQPIPVSVVVRVSAAPSAGAPASDSTRDSAQLTAVDAADLGRLAVLHPELHLTLAVPPFLLEEWAGAGVEQTSTPSFGSDAIDSLRRAVQAGTPLLRGMYADPDLSGIATVTADLELQAARGEAAVAAVLSPGPPASSNAATGFAALSGPLPPGAARVIVALGVRYAVTDTSCIEPAGGAAVAEAYAVTLPAGDGSAGATLTVLATDRAGSARMTDPTKAASLAAELFSRALSGQRPHAIVLVVDVGADGVRTASVAQSLDSLVGIPWVRLVDTPTAAGASAPPAATLRANPVDATPAPDGLRAQIADARARVSGLLAAAGPSDPDAKRALDFLLLAESRAWAGADGSWSEADRGSALARAAADGADAVLMTVTLDAPSVTLPGSEGKAPVSILNASGRTLTVDLDTTSDDVRVQRARTPVRLRPGENVLSVPVSLGTATSGHLRFAVTAGAFEIATATATVTASYQDRIVLLATVLAILAGLLFYIRRHLNRGPRSRAGDGDLEEDPDA